MSNILPPEYTSTSAPRLAGFSSAVPEAESWESQVLGELRAIHEFLRQIQEQLDAVTTSIRTGPTSMDTTTVPRTAGEPMRAEDGITMKVGELLDALAGYPRDTDVVMEVECMEWRALSRLNPPIKNPEDMVQAAVCLVRGAQIL